MTTQLTLISVPAHSPRQGEDADAVDDRVVRRAPTLRRVPPPAATSDPAAVPPAASGAGQVGSHHRSAEHQGWLDRRTISTGRKGVAAARAALADANRRVAARKEQDDAERQARLASVAEQAARRADHAA